MILTADTLPIDALEELTTAQNLKLGRTDFAAGMAKVDQTTLQGAWVTVTDIVRAYQTYRVSIGLFGPQLVANCTCRVGYGPDLCRHRVAAMLALHDYLTENPPSVWKSILDNVVRTPSSTRRRSVSRGPIVFSLQFHRSDAWQIVPMVFSSSHIDPALLADEEALAQQIAKGKLEGTPRPVRSRVSKETHPDASEAAIEAANILNSGSSGYAHYSYSDALYTLVLPRLTACLVFSGEQQHPLKKPLHVRATPARIVADVEKNEGGLIVSSQLQIGERRVPLRGKIRTLTSNPPWIIVGDEVVSFEETSAAVQTLLANPAIDIPARDQEEFLDRYLLPLADVVDVEGSAVAVETLALPPEPRLYLSEGKEGLQAALRFGYGDYELPYDKALPAQSTRRTPGSLALAKIARDPASEETAYTELSSYGLKRSTTEPGTALLRKNTHPIDFLLKQVPKLAEHGYVVYGEENIKSARVNRNPPRISFNVKTGIDWFDVAAAVNFGEIEVPLKTIRQAIRQKARFIKLTDGTIGALPQEWVDRYKHLWALGEDHGEELRFNAAHVTLLDQLLTDADAAQVDPEFTERRERLRNFERIESQPLPPDFVGELRPYQKFGYDWLHFLREYGFGGILADDMGLGKCIAPETRVAVNGTLIAAVDLWSNFATNLTNDGEGDWALPSAPLTVHALDERTGKLTQARVARLYRQAVDEPMRRVRLEDGSTITITGRHQLLTNHGWSAQLTVGDYVCVPQRLDWDGSPCDPDLVELLAWQIAEGYEQRARPIVIITQKDVTVLERLKDLVQRMAVRYNIQLGTVKIHCYGNKAPFLSISGRGYQEFLSAIGHTWGQLAAGKRIPDRIVQADNQTIQLFLRHLFEAEGTATLSTRCVEIVSASPEMMAQVTLMLRRFGIWMRTAVRYKAATNGTKIKRPYTVGIIAGASVRRFAHQIRFVSERKNSVLDAICEHSENTNTEGIPASQIVGQLVSTTGLPVRHFGMHNTVYLNGSQEFSRTSLGRVIESVGAVLNGETERVYRQLPRSKWTAQTLTAYSKLDHDHVATAQAQLRQLYEREVFYCRIAAIETVHHTGYVYDLEIAEHHNFVAEGIICHNTIQVLAFLESLYHAEPELPATLVVLPRSLLFNWQREAEKFTPELAVTIHADAGRTSVAEEFAHQDVVLTTYGTMLRDIELLRQYEFHYVILDESQAIKNPVAETSKAARALRSDHRLALTGTPVENSAIELWSQFAFLNPGLLGNIEYFRAEFAARIERAQDGETAQLLRRMIFPFILRRTKEQVALDLPPRTEEVVVCDMAPAQRSAYIAKRDAYRNQLLGLVDEGGMQGAQMAILEALLRLRQLANHPALVDPEYTGGSGKFEQLIERLETLRAEGHRALVFSQFVQMLSLVRKALDERGVRYAYLDGSTKKRQQVVDSFQEGDAPFFLISLKAGGVGLNLTGADYVIHIDPWWNPAVEQQATDRAHRIGQTKPVFVTRLVTRETVEEKVLLLQEQKRALVEQLVGAEGGVFKSLTRDDIEVLLT